MKNQVTIHWPADKVLPECGSVLDVGILGKARVAAIECHGRDIYFTLQEREKATPSARAILYFRVTFFIFQTLGTE